MDETKPKRGKGRPTKYRPEYKQAMIDYFSQPTETIKKKTIVSKSGVQIVEEPVANKFPTIEGFAMSIGVDGNTVKLWAETHPDFMVTYKRCADLGQEFLLQNGLKGHYHPAVFQFVAQNYTKMRNKQEVEHTVRPLVVLDE